MPDDPKQPAKIVYWMDEERARRKAAGEPTGERGWLWKLFHQPVRREEEDCDDDGPNPIDPFWGGLFH